MKEVVIKLKAKISESSGDSDSLEISSLGFSEKGEGFWTFEYDESDLTGLEGSKTKLTVFDNKVFMNRNNIGGSNMEFQTNKRFVTEYATPYGLLKLEILTRYIDVNLDDLGKGNIKITYDMSIKGMTETLNELEISVF
jgi:uncharacterized beta-barrel protein YwiB (DUF1934 family)